MKVNMTGLINQLDSLRKRINDLFDNLDNLEELEQEDIEIETVQQYFQNDDTFNLSITLDILEQAEKLDKALEIIENKKVNVKELLAYFEWENGFSYYNEYLCEEEQLTKEEYEFLRGVFKK